MVAVGDGVLRPRLRKRLRLRRDWTLRLEVTSLFPLTKCIFELEGRIGI